MPAQIKDRWYSHVLAKKTRSPFVHILFGARQSGKSTLLRSLLPANAVVLDFSDPAERARYAARPSELIAMCRALPRAPAPRVVFIDEAQAVPAIFDAVQNLYDSDKRRWRFILCGSSARKLRRTEANLLPGRSFLYRLQPLMLCEQPFAERSQPETPAVIEMAWPAGKPANPFPSWKLEDRLAYGSLPGVVTAKKADRSDILRAYAALHIEEEIRRETLIRNWGDFLQFLRFAALSSGSMLNYASISQETGISQPTVKSYFQLLEDMFIGIRIPSYTRSPRKGLIVTPRFYFFDLGVRNAAAGLSPSTAIVNANPGPLFEQWVGLELWKRLQYLGRGGISYFRTRSGSEIDFIIETDQELTPVEAKWTENPSLRDARGMLAFLEDQPALGRRGYIVCRCPRPLLLHEKVLALPWQYL
jgi:predicted AAA+ superfamily ATPase